MSGPAQPTEPAQPTAPTDATEPTEPTAVGPALRLVRGDAAPEELAALLAVLAARGSGAAAVTPPVPQRGRWGDPAAGLRGRLDPGPGAWVAAGWARRG